MNQPVVSILMAVYNAEAFLEKALQSVLQQTYPHWQLICVDDASVDASLTILHQFANQDDRIIVLHQDFNQGQAVARNRGLELAKGDYIAMLDADDWLSEDCLQKVVEAFAETTDSVVLRLMQHYEDGREEVYPTPYADDAVLTGFEAFHASLDWTLHGLYVVRRDIHLRYPYDTSCHLFSDDNTTRLHFLHSREVRFCTGTYYYRKHAASCTNAMSADRFLYMQANLSMKQTLERELAEASASGSPSKGMITPSVLRFYEEHRWLNYIGQIWLYVQHRQQLSPEERQRIQSDFRRIYSTFTYRPVPIKFGYTWFSPHHLGPMAYPLFLLQETLYFSLRLLIGR